ncbi:Lovastatin nonaketide synthase [Penicillium pulvis]|uniref:Lovastatin nonaketide synthase n=1 Tax=Penicillium pulvis TaxID=1562058 RepID=UPI002546D369|nr:Lovastatin nonaketide synthase [Penicillium pulvis]KAJ5813636.1 Lovastatin nonaketide synthase [Penicillium pulvis]
MITMGEYLANSLGNEAAGIVSRVGIKVDRLKPGERVVFLGGVDTGCFHTFGRIDQDVVVPLPDSISFETAAGLPCVYSTVLYGLREAAHLSKGETILIHAAAVGVGQAAIQYAKIVGAEIYATVSTLEKRQLIISKYELTPFLRNVTMTSVELPTMRHKPSMIGQLTADAIRLFEEGKIREATPTTILKYSQVEEGLRLLQSGKGTGKMILVPEQEDRIPLIPDLSSPLFLDPNASYILAGALGGIGRSIARWMVSRGAKQLIFLSRSGRAESDVDSMFGSMSYNDWQTAVRPKVKGSWNLHNSPPKDVDSFVMLSSATGIIGNKSQANYATGNTYQDALAQYRVSQGLRGSSVDLGSILQVGFVAENMQYARHTTATLRSLREDEVHSILEYLLSEKVSHSACQVIAGLSDETLYNGQDVLPPSYFAFLFFAHLRKPSTVRKMTSETNPSSRVQSLLQAATTLEEAVGIVTEGI